MASLSVAAGGWAARSASPRAGVQRPLLRPCCRADPRPPVLPWERRGGSPLWVIHSQAWAEPEETLGGPPLRQVSRRSPLTRPALQRAARGAVPTGRVLGRLEYGVQGARPGKPTVHVAVATPVTFWLAKAVADKMKWPWPHSCQRCGAASLSVLCVCPGAAGSVTSSMGIPVWHQPRGAHVFWKSESLRFRSVHGIGVAGLQRGPHVLHPYPCDWTP